MTPKINRANNTESTSFCQKEMMTESHCRFTLLAMDVVDITILGNKTKLKIQVLNWVL
jgi:hypothetical protein